ncbi:MAG TPA: serine hydrolase domain-containing protein [Candidatus Aminicenantes bacterium]|nr:serine hydrolase domain-containing protein [Candidatus Aminicenantes bacterium]HRY63910.1 serine hydrolase domain-containing protein [Candidatus Aminicenantes bacterium]HRZ70823.1 serine hydrolase domain-containing protein [Candidatus Aminicenantes bacterium]
MKMRHSSFIVFAAGLAIVLAGCSSCSGGGDDGGPSGITAEDSFGSVIPALMSKWNIPGGSVALARNGSIVLAKGYGVADKSGPTAVTAASLFRLASLSKPVTAAAVLKLYEAGSLNLDARVFDILTGIEPPDGASVDARLASITVRDLLRHSGGWDRTVSFDPMFRSREIAAALGVAPPADAAAIIRYMKGQPLDLDPGTRYAYSNFGYCLLGRVIERVSGQSYGSYVRSAVLTPAGAGGMVLGRSLEADRASGEVVYYDYAGAPLAQSVFDSGPAEVPWPYGGFALEPLDANGGWLASASDLLRFLLAVDGRTVPADILQPATIALMVERPPLAEYQSSASYYALGWMVRPTSGDANWWHTGSLPGTATIMVRTAGGLGWVALFNSRPESADAFISELDSELWRAVNAVTDWTASSPVRAAR